jgi:hypothetical protein
MRNAAAVVERSLLSGRVSAVAQVTLYGASLVPIVAAVLLVSAYGVNVPFLDDWLGMVSLIHKLSSSHLTFADLFGQYTDHRPFFPRLFLLGLAKLTHFNVVAELWAVQATNVLLLTCLLVATRIRDPRAALPLLAPFVAFLVFTPRLQENWFIGFNGIAWGFVPAFGVLALLLLDLMRTQSRRIALFGGALVCATIPGFSLVSGLAVWPAGLIQLLLIARSHPWARRLAAVWFAVGIIEISAYFYGLQQRSYQQGYSYNFVHPLEATGFFLRLLGSSLFFTEGAALVGGILLAAAGVATLILALRFGEGGRRSFWTAVSVFSLTATLLVTWGRSGLGPGVAITSRYADPARLLVISMLAFLVTMALSQRSRACAALAVMIAGLVAVSAIVNYPHVIEIGREIRAHRQWAAWVLATNRQQPDEFLFAVEFPPGVSEPRGNFTDSAADLERRRYTVFSGSRKPVPPDGPTPFASTVPISQPSICALDAVAGLSPADAETSGVPRDHPLTAVGWCRDELANDVSGGVYAIVDGKPYPLFDRMQRPDVAAYLASENYLYAGFIGLVPRLSRLAGRHTLQIVALSHDGKRRFAPTAPITFTLR